MTRLPLRRAAFVLTCLLGLLCIGAVYVTLDGVTDQLIEQDRRSIADRRDLRERIAEHEVVNDALAQQVKALGGKPVVAPSTDPSLSPYIPVPGPRGPRGFFGPRGKASTVPGPPSTVPGPPGKDSTVPGPEGKPGKDSTVPGPEGPEGKPGRGIASIDCNEANDWVFTLTDGTALQVPGPCRVVVEPTPDPVPES